MYPNNLTPTQALSALMDDVEDIIDKNVKILYVNLVRASPVETGNFRRSWDLNKGISSWTISNTAEYATQLSGGRRLINGRYYGSIQWSAGLGPMMLRFTKKLKRELGNIRY